MKIGIMGGTFNPIHNGHIHIAKAAFNDAKLDKVLFLPTGVSYMKQGVVPSFHRFNMTKLAIEDYEYFDISDIEVKRPGFTYTKDTIEELKAINPEDELYYIIGTDTLYMIEKWYEPQYLFSNLIFLVADRGDENSKLKAKELSESFNASISFLNCDFLDISSTYVREKIVNKEYDLIASMVPEKVLDYIKTNKIYDELSIPEIIRILKEELPEKRFYHTIGVRDMAVSLAKKYGVDINKAEIAALLHDCAKNMSLDNMHAICDRYFFNLSSLEAGNEGLLHSKAGACLAVEKYGIKDQEILDAIIYHTTGRPGMNTLEKIIYISDFIEINRKHSPKLPEYRKRVFYDLDSVLIDVLHDCIYHVKSVGHDIDSTSEETFKYYTNKK